MSVHKGRVSIIIVNCNGKALLENCLASCTVQSYRDFEMIIVDNGSSDGSQDFVRTAYPRAALIENKNNTGFAPAANQGIEVSCGEFVALLNNDTRVDREWVSSLVKAIRSDEIIGSCASKQMDFSRADIIDAAGLVLFRGGYAGSRGHAEKDEGQFEAREFVFGCHGASAFYRKAMLDEIGLFDEDYFAYNEEFDLALRAQLCGWKCVYVPEAVVFHMGGATRARQDEDFRLFQMERNRLCTIIKGYPLAMLCYYSLFLAKYELDAFFRLLRRGTTTFLRARFDCIRLLPRMLKKRRDIQRTRTITHRGFRELVTVPPIEKGDTGVCRV